MEHSFALITRVSSTSRCKTYVFFDFKNHIFSLLSPPFAIQTMPVKHYYTLYFVLIEDLIEHFHVNLRTIDERSTLCYYYHTQCVVISTYCDQVSDPPYRSESSGSPRQAGHRHYFFLRWMSKLRSIHIWWSCMICTALRINASSCYDVRGSYLGRSWWPLRSTWD